MPVSTILSVIVVSWNVKDLLHQCLDSIFSSWGDSPGLEVIVVDNASADHSVVMVQEQFPAVQLVINQTNLGYPAGCNQGLTLASGQYLLILNPDTEIIGSALATLVNYMADNPLVGMVGPMLANPDGTHQSSRRRFPTLPILFLESTWLEKCAPRKLLAFYYFQDVPDSRRQEVDWITGAAMMIRRKVWQQVGGMDEGFFMYSEELDWCRRIKQSGWQIMFLPHAKIIHHEGKSSEQVAAERHIYFQTSKIRYTRIYHGAIAAFFLHHWLRFQYIVQIFLECSKWIVGHKREMRSQRIIAYKKVILSRFR